MKLLQNVMQFKEHINTYFVDILGCAVSTSDLAHPQRLKYILGNMELTVVWNDECLGGQLITVLSKDCVHDYITLKALGVNFFGQLDYVANGVAAKFIDPFGNLYQLLEDRSHAFENV